MRLVPALLATAILATPLAPFTSVPAAAQASRCGDVWRVSPGDTLSAIARACGIPTSRIQALNPSVDWSRLAVGARVALVGNAAGPRPAPGGPARPEGYVVRRGDTLASIARSFGLSVGALRAANPGLSERDLQVGRTIYFAGRGAPTPPPVRPAPDRPAPARAEIRLDERENFPGGSVGLRVSGLRAGETVSVEAGPRRGRGTVDDEARADRRGTAELVLDLPGRASPGETFDYEVSDERGRTVADGSFRIGEERRRPGRPDRPQAERVSVTGVLSNEGATCPTLRGEDGRLYSLAGDLAGYRGGDRVAITGRTAEMSVCMQGTTISIDQIRPAR